MGMNATQVALNVKGVNKTGKVFAEIAASAARVGKSAAMFGASAFAGATVAIAAAAKSLGHLSAVSMQAGTSAGELSKLSEAMEVIGIKSSSPEQLASAFQNMTKSIGESGVGGFRKAILAISEMRTAEERAAASMAVFGGAGKDFLPLIEAAAKDGLAALDEVVSAMPGISSEAAAAGKEVSTAMQLVTSETKSLWFEAIGNICSWFDGQFAGGIKEAALKLNAYLEYGVKKLWRECVASFENIGKAWRALSDDWGATFSKCLSFCWDLFAGFGRMLWEQLKNVGALIRDFGKQLWSFIKGDGFDFKAIFENTNFVDTWKNFADGVKESMSRNDLFDGVEWSEAKLDDLESKLGEKLAKAGEVAVAIGKSAVTAAAEGSAGDTAEKIGRAVKAMKAEFVDASSYKAATMSIRADYGKGESKTVGAVNGVKKVNEKMADLLKQIAEGVGNVPAV